MSFAQRGDERLLARELLAIGNNRHHDLPCALAHAHNRMAQQALAGILVVGGNVKALRELGDAIEYGASCLVFDQTLAHLDELVRTALVHAKTRLTLPAGRIRRHDLVTIGNRLVHADYGINTTAKWLEELLEHRALARKLNGVGDGKPLAATATCSVRTGVCLVAHGVYVTRLRA